MPPTILIVEDTQSLAMMYQSYLLPTGVNTLVANDGATALNIIDKIKPDLIVLDVMLPGTNGLDICRQVREQKPEQAIIMLTARADEFDEVIGFEAGANDYVIKPVRPRALLARIHSSLKNQVVPEQNSNEIKLGRLEINGEANRVVFKGEEIELSTSLFSFLWFLASHAGEVVDRDTVFKALKGREYDGQDRSIDVRVSRIRPKVGDDPMHPRRIKTVRSKGYLFVKEV